MVRPSSVKKGYLVSAIATLIGSIVRLFSAVLSVSVIALVFLSELAEDTFWHWAGGSTIAGWWLGSSVCCGITLKVFKYEKVQLTTLWVAALMLINIGCVLMSTQLQVFSFGAGGAMDCSSSRQVI